MFPKLEVKLLGDWYAVNDAQWELWVEVLHVAAKKKNFEMNN